MPFIKAFLSKDIYQGPYADLGPDIVMGFNLGYRISWSSPMGNFPKDIIVDNKEKWSGDHCIAPELVPGILFMNRKIKTNNPKFLDITPTILKIFGIDKPAEMTGVSVI